MRSLAEELEDVEFLKNVLEIGKPSSFCYLIAIGISEGADMGALIRRCIYNEVSEIQAGCIFLSSTKSSGMLRCFLSVTMLPFVSSIEAVAVNWLRVKGHRGRALGKMTRAEISEFLWASKSLQKITSVVSSIFLDANVEKTIFFIVRMAGSFLGEDPLAIVIQIVFIIGIKPMLGKCLAEIDERVVSVIVSTMEEKFRSFKYPDETLLSELPTAIVVSGETKDHARIMTASMDFVKVRDVLFSSPSPRAAYDNFRAVPLVRSELDVLRSFYFPHGRDRSTSSPVRFSNSSMVPKNISIEDYPAAWKIEDFILWTKKAGVEDALPYIVPVIVSIEQILHEADGLASLIPDSDLQDRYIARFKYAMQKTPQTVASLCKSVPVHQWGPEQIRTWLLICGMRCLIDDVLGTGQGVLDLDASLMGWGQKNITRFLKAVENLRNIMQTVHLRS